MSGQASFSRINIFFFFLKQIPDDLINDIKSIQQKQIVRILFTTFDLTNCLIRLIFLVNQKDDQN